MVSKGRTNARTRNGQKVTERDGRTDTDSYIELSCLSGEVYEEIRKLDLVAFQIEQAWGEDMLSHVSEEWRTKFIAQRDRLNKLIEQKDNNSAVLGNLPDEVPHFHVDEIIKLLPDSIFKVKNFWPDSTIQNFGNKEDFNDEIPFG